MGHKSKLVDPGDSSHSVQESKSSQVIALFLSYPGEVKISGVRIECEEVAAVLKEHPVVADALVTVPWLSGRGIAVGGVLLPVTVDEQVSCFWKKAFTKHYHPVLWGIGCTHPLWYVNVGTMTCTP